MYVVLDYEGASLLGSYVVKHAKTPSEAIMAYAVMLKRRYPKEHPESVQELYRMIKESESIEVVNAEEL